MRFLILGTGSIGRRHISNLRELDQEAEFLIVRENGREDVFSKELRATIVPEIMAALRFRPALAIIATPSDCHFKPLKQLVECGIPTLVEKPVVTDLAQVAELEVLDPGTPTQVGCVLRFLTSVQKLKSWLDEGRAGNVVRASLEAGQYLPDWRPTQDYRASYSADPDRGGGVIFDLVHELDLAAYLFGDVELLAASADKLSDLSIQSEDTALMTLRAPSGALISVAVDYVSRRPTRAIRIVGDKGTLTLDFVARTLDQIGPDGLIERCTDGFDTNEAYRAELLDLMVAAETGRRTRLPLSEGLRATRLAIAARQMADPSNVPRTIL